MNEAMSRNVSQAVVDMGLALHDNGYVHETANPFEFIVGSPKAGLYGYRVNVAEGSCRCKAGQMRKVCKHVVAAGAAYFGRGA